MSDTPPDPSDTPGSTGRPAPSGASDPAELARRRADLESRLGAREARRARDAAPDASRSDLARGLKLSSEFIAGIVVGAIIGYLFDRIAGTSPFGLVVFLMLGFAAGILNVLRAAGEVAGAETRIGPAGRPDSVRDGTDDDAGAGRQDGA